MFRRILVVGVVAVIALLALAAPAEAKGPESAVISGPGIESTPLTWVSAEDDLATLLDIAFPWDDVGKEASRAEPPLAELGAMYAVTYRMPEISNHSRAGTVRQALYPFAEGGPLVYTPPGQRMLGMPVDSGWQETSTRLTLLLRGLGADPDAVTNQAVIAPAAQTAAPDDSGSSWPWIAAGAAGVGVLLGIGVLWRTRHRLDGQTG
ncbi:MAG: hypothetical protein ACRDQD_05905 [Nocardioidaceae bacterium]